MSEELSYGRPYTAAELSNLLHNERVERAEEINALAVAIGLERVREAGSILEAVKQLASRPAPAVQVPEGVLQKIQDFVWAKRPLFDTIHRWNRSDMDAAIAEALSFYLAAAPAHATVATEAVAQGGGVGGWQPIETAPKQGWVEVLVRGDSGCAVAYFDPDEGEWLSDYRGKGNWQYVHALWWQPLPPAPAATKKEEGHEH